MSTFAIVFYTLMIAASCLAAYYHRREAFMVLFSLTLISFLMGLLGGEVWLRYIAVAIGLLYACGGLAYSFREFLVQTLPRDIAKVMRNAPLTASFGLFVIVVYIVAAIFAPVIAPFGEAEVVGSSYAPPDDTMILGGDQLGRDMFSRIIYGARNTVGIALLTTALAFLVGSLVGLMAATLGGWVDQVCGRVVDTLMAIPSLVFALLLLTIVGTNVVNLILVIALLYSPVVFRLARAVAGNIVVMDYIEAARLRGEKTWYLIISEILPNATAPLVAEFGLRFCFVFLAISALSFLGLGIQPPTADWGSMVRENATLISFGEITPLIPAAAIALLTVAVNFVVDWMLHLSSGLKE
ncbi:MAG: ABC transporter permease [Thiotrichales bacterium]|nr:ABC transporter permease [Thiotrichales bacterium]MCY4285917.1 ABC transporter permease [Thiotrichales bacterium]MCY4348570.1 ABC transporter permease [Thiotrichales bacterium]